MSFPPSFTDVSTAILLVIPGFIALIISKKIGRMEEILSDFENTIISLFLSVVTYLIFFKLRSDLNISSIGSLLFQFDSFILIYIIAMVLGLIIGSISLLIFKQKIILTDSWIYFQNVFKNDEKEHWITVFLKNNQEYRGQLDIAGRKGSKDLVLFRPVHIIRDSEWRELTQIEMGAEILIKEDDISRVIFDEKIP